MSKFYGDILRDFSDSYTKNFYGGFPVIVKFKTSPSEATSVSQRYRLARNVDNSGAVTYSPTNAVTLKTACNDKQVATKFKFGNGAAVYEVTYKPKDINKDGKVFNLKHNSAFEVASQNVQSTESLKFGSNLFSDVNGALNIDYIWNNKLAAQTVKGAVNFTKDKVNFGVKAEQVLGEKKPKSLLAQASYATQKVDHFFLYDIQKRFLTYATLSNSQYKADQTHACDIVFDTQNKAKWFWGYPVKSSWAGIYRLNSDSTFRIKLLLEAQNKLSWSWGQVINKNLTVNFSHDLNLCQTLGLASSEQPYNFGLQFQFSL